MTMNKATLFISNNAAALAAERYLSNVVAGVVKIGQIVRRNPDSREVERGYVAHVTTEALSFYL